MMINQKIIMISGDDSNFWTIGLFCTFVLTPPEHILCNQLDLVQPCLYIKSLYLHLNIGPFSWVFMHKHL